MSRGTAGTSGPLLYDRETEDKGTTEMLTVLRRAGGVQPYSDHSPNRSEGRVQVC